MNKKRKSGFPRQDLGAQWLKEQIKKEVQEQLHSHLQMEERPFPPRLEERKMVEWWEGAPDFLNERPPAASRQSRPYEEPPIWDGWAGDWEMESPHSKRQRSAKQKKGTQSHQRQPENFDLFGSPMMSPHKPFAPFGSPRRHPQQEPRERWDVPRPRRMDPESNKRGWDEVSNSFDETARLDSLSSSRKRTKRKR